MDKTSSKRRRISEVVKGELSETTEVESKVTAVGRAEREHVSKKARADNERKS